MYDMVQHRIELNRLGKVIIYLRKSREDMIDGRYASDEETLSRHLGQLQEWAVRNLGYEIPENCIFKEVVSGEKIKNRPVFQEVLKKVELEDIDGILVVNCSRLSRGDLVDCGNIIKILELTDTFVLTPQKVYNLKDKYDKRFFKDELLRGNDYLEQVKELLYNGRHWSVAQGKFIGSSIPYGYDKVSCKEMNVGDGKGYTLKPNENAKYVKMIYDWYLNEGIGSFLIASRLIAMGVPRIKDKEWDHCKVRKILTNPVYYGYLTFGKRTTKEKIVDGEVVQYRSSNKDYPIYKGLHEAIISEEDFMKVQSQAKENMTAPIKRHCEQKSPFVGILKCGVCGRAMVRQPHYNRVTTKRKYELNKAELQDFLNEHKRKMNLTNAELKRKLNISKDQAYKWFGKNPEKFYPSEIFVEKWCDIKKILNITDTNFDAIVTEFEDVPYADTINCSDFRCKNISSNFEIVEKIILNKIKKRYEAFNHYLDNYEEEYTKVIKANKKNSANIDKKIAMVQRQLKNAKIAYEQEVDTLEEYIERKKELNQELDLLLKQKEDIEKDGEEDKIIYIKKSIPILKNVFEDYYKLSVEEKSELLKMVMESVMYIKTEQRNDDSIDLDICWKI